MTNVFCVSDLVSTGDDISVMINITNMYDSNKILEIERSKLRWDSNTSCGLLSPKIYEVRNAIDEHGE